LVIVGVTGPVCIFSATVYQLSKSFDLPFLPWMGWIAIWASIMHVALALTGSCRFVSWVTRYACETFGSLIGMIYVWTACADLVRFFQEEKPESALLSMILCLGAHVLSDVFSEARDWTMFRSSIRETIANYAVASSVLIFTIVSIITRDHMDVDVPRIATPNVFEPTLKRAWGVDLLSCPGKGIGMAVLPAFILTVLFFFDHNVSSLMAQAPEFKLRKPPAYNWDFFVIGLLILVCGLLGLPFTNGLIPQAPLHVHALCKREEQIGDDGLVHVVVTRVEEQRLSNFTHAFLIGLCCLPPVLKTLQLVPLAVLSGLFLFMGMGSFKGNGFFNRLFLPVTDPERRSSVCYGDLEPLLATRGGCKEVAGYTLLQFLLWVLIFAVTKTPAAISFPMFIAALVLVRWAILPRLFSKQAISLLDGEHEKEVVKQHVEVSGGGDNAVSNWDALNNDVEDTLTRQVSGTPHFAFHSQSKDVHQENEALRRVSKRRHSSKSPRSSSKASGA